MVYSKLSCLAFLIAIEEENPGETVIPSSYGKGICLALVIVISAPASLDNSSTYSADCSMFMSRDKPVENHIIPSFSLHNSRFILSVRYEQLPLSIYI